MRREMGSNSVLIQYNPYDYNMLDGVHVSCIAQIVIDMGAPACAHVPLPGPSAPRIVGKIRARLARAQGGQND
jgi:hypothetical protein